MHYNPEDECKLMVVRIKEYCRKRKLTPRGLAEKAGLSSSTVSYILNGRTKPQIYTILQICNALDVSVEQLFSNNVKTHPMETIEGEESLLTDEEERILRVYRQFPDRKKEMLRTYIEMLYSYDVR